MWKILQLDLTNLLQYPIPIYHFSPFAETDIQKRSDYVELIRLYYVISPRKIALKRINAFNFKILKIITPFPYGLTNII